jgi:catechol 2,3-dioxygenase-like lactoylglutathione lyase family enzyme
MLSKARVVPTIAVVDLDAARAFYVDVLGLPEVDHGAGWLVVGSSDAALELYQKPGTQPADSTRAQFEVDDLDAEVKALEARGAVFEALDMPEGTRHGVISDLGPNGRMAWLKDCEGNWLALHERRPADPLTLLPPDPGAEAEQAASVV